MPQLLLAASFIAIGIMFILLLLYYSVVTMSAERVAELTALSKRRDIYELLAAALAPSIYEHEDIKKGILLQLFGGTKKDFTHAGRGNFRLEAVQGSMELSAPVNNRLRRHSVCVSVSLSDSLQVVLHIQG